MPNCIAQCITVQRSASLYNTVHHCTAKYSAALYLVNHCIVKGSTVYRLHSAEHITLHRLNASHYIHGTNRGRGEEGRGAPRFGSFSLARAPSPPPAMAHRDVKL